VRFFSDTLKKLKLTGWLGTLVLCSKGLVHPGGHRLSEFTREGFPDKDVPIVVLSGPSHAEEVGQDLPTAVVAASSNRQAAEQIQALMMTPRFRVYTNSDVAGVEIGLALKNVLAIASGISDGLGFGDNSRAALITRGLKEIIQLGLKVGGQMETFMGLTGLGDLVVTCTSRHSRNRRLGELIGQGYAPQEALKRVEMVAEGYYTAKNVEELEKNLNLELPICREVYKILYEGKDPSAAVNDLMSRERKSEAIV
jgi:glycerol-3-phosphate dehydrogenase (NAD(P)+)